MMYYQLKPVVVKVEPTGDGSGEMYVRSIEDIISPTERKPLWSFYLTERQLNQIATKCEGRDVLIALASEIEG